MKWTIRFLVCLFFICCGTKGVSQVVLSPVFDRTDTFKFRVEKVSIQSDTTYVFCSYEAEESSWANISKETYLEDIESGIRYHLLKVVGLPFAPEKRHFLDKETIQVLLCFPHVDTKKFNIVENEYDKAFNIYGIDLENSFTTAYTTKDIAAFYNFAVKEEEKDNQQLAINFYYKQLESAKYVEGLRSLSSACAMYNLLLAYFIKKEYGNSIEWGERAIDILEELPQDSISLDFLARSYGSVGTIYEIMNKNDEKALQYLELSLATRRMIGKTRGLDYEEYLQHMAKKYYYEEDYPKALLYGKEVVDIYKRKYDENSEYGCYYLNSLNNLCEYCQRMNKFEEAIDYGKQALEQIEKGVCQDSISLFVLKRANYINLAGALATLGQKDDAIRYLESVITETNKNSTKEDKFSITARMLLADILLNEKQDTLRALKEYDSLQDMLSDSIAHNKGYCSSYAELLRKLYCLYKGIDSNIALRYLKKHINVIKDYNGEESISFANACVLYYNDVDIFLNSLGGDSCEKDTLFYYLQQSSDILKRHISSSVYTMSNSERTNYWQRFKYIYSWFIPTVCSFMEGAKEANSLAYDATLFYKGMLLSADKEFKDVIQSSQDTSLVSLYSEYIKNLSLLEALPPPAYSKVCSDSLKSVIHNQEFSLSQKVTRYNKKYKGTNYSWKEIKNKLNNEDVAIEITSYPSVDGSTIYYDAYIIENKSVTPWILFLCSEDQIRNCIQNDSIDYWGLSKLIWGNEHLVSLIKDKKNIFVSASGLLNSIGFEYLPLENGQYIFDHYNIYRLSSTRELCSVGTPIKPENVCLFGGLDYNSANECNANNTPQTYHVSRSIVDSLVIRGGFDPLFGSKQEVEQVKCEFLKHDIDCKTYTDSKGTEESFKNLNGSQINIIHLSTHGMYIPVEEQIKSSHYRFILPNDFSNVDEEAFSLSHSFLVMSGGNKLIHNDRISSNEEDGILTALEISHLDFYNLDLVVLSACETGLGEIDSEGVFGLQRAFKKAGANTILMSIGKVDDEATRILMVEFYRNLMTGKTKLLSLHNAQQYLRQVDNGKYDAPKYWASFIMLDGLN